MNKYTYMKRRLPPAGPQDTVLIPWDLAGPPVLATSWGAFGGEVRKMEAEEEGVGRRGRANVTRGRSRGGSRCPALSGAHLPVASKGSLSCGAHAGGAPCSLLGQDAPRTRSDGA